MFGDSIAIGLWDDRGGWPERLWDGRSRFVYNLGVDGETSEDVRKRFESEAESRANRNSVIIIAVGVNDSSRIDTANRVSLTDYTENVGQMIDIARERFTKRIMCVGLAPIDQRQSRLSWRNRFLSSLRIGKRTKAALKNLSESKGVAYVSLANIMIEKYLSEDGVHPLPAGHLIIAQKVMKTLRRLP